MSATTSNSDGAEFLTTSERKTPITKFSDGEIGAATIVLDPEDLSALGISKSADEVTFKVENGILAVR
jgi:formylmethanofuran dehydrogenase subunit D